MPVVVSDDESASVHIVSQPRRTVTLSSQLTDANNDATPELSIHRNKPPPPAITQNLLADKCVPDEGVMKDRPHESKHLQHAVANTRADTSFDVLTDAESTAPVEMHLGTLDSEGFECINDTCTTVSDTSNTMRGHAQSDAVDGNGLLEDTDVQDISLIMKACREDKTMDISAFFGAPYAAKLKDSKTCNVRDCKSCHKKGFPHQIVSDTSTCQCHVAYRHLDAYCKWRKANKFKSMLTLDVKEQKNAAMVTSAQQGSLDPHLHEVQLGKHVLPYSDKLFREATIKWLTSTNQPIQAVDHLSFKKMIDTASWATMGVLIPNRKAT